MNKKMMLLPLLFLILIVPMVDASEGNETDVIILPPPPPPPPLPITNETDPVIIVTDQDLASIQLRLDSIYVWMKTRDELMINGRNAAREINATLSDAIVDLDNITDKVSTLQDDNTQLLDVIEDLTREVEQVHRELEMERANRNNLTIMFGLFSIIIIVITYARARRE